MKHVKVNTLIITISLIASLFSCSLNAMTAIQPKSSLSMERRKAMLATIPKGKILEAARTSEATLKKTNVIDILATSCKKDELFIHEQESDLGICVPVNVIEMSQALTNLIEDMGGTKNVLKQKTPIPLIGFPISVIKDTFDVLKKYEENQSQPKDKIQSTIKEAIDGYSRERLIGIANCINYLDCTKKVQENVQNICLDEIKNNYKGDIEAIISNQNLNPDLRKMFIVEQVCGFIISLLQKQNMQNTKRILRDYSQGGPDTSFVAINSDGTKIVEGLAYNFVVRDDLGKILHRNRFAAQAVSVVAMSPDGKKIVVGNAMLPDLTIYDADSGKVLHNLAGHQGKITSVAFSRDGTRIVSGGFGNINNIIVWDAETGNQIVSMGGIAGPVTAVAFNSDGTKIVSGHFSKDNNPADVVVWNIENIMQPRSTYFNGFGKTINSVSFCPTDDTKILYVGDSADTKTSLLNVKTTEAFLLDVNNKKSTKLTQGPRKTEGLGVFSFPIKALFTPDGKTIVIDETNGIRMLNLDNNYNAVEETFSKIGNPWNKLRSMAISLDGRKMVVGYTGNEENNDPALIVFTLWTNDDQKIIDQIETGSFAQTELIFKLYSEFKRHGSVKQLHDNKDIEQFKLLPQEIQNLLSKNLSWSAKDESSFYEDFSRWLESWRVSRW